MSYARRELRWNGWGRYDRTYDFHGHEEQFWRFVAEIAGVAELPHTPARHLQEVELPASRLSANLVDSLRSATSAERVKLDRYERAFHARGKSYPDLIRLRRGEVESAPDAVVYPESHDEVLAVLRLCAERDVAVIPFGGGSSVVGGVEASPGDRAAAITLDTTRMYQLLELDSTSMSATFQSGAYGPTLEGELETRDYTLGHFPQSFEFSTLGGWIAARSSGQQSRRYGSAHDWVLGARLATPEGEIHTRNFPNSAAGPDLDELIAGSEGSLGVITEATVRLHRAPARRDYRAYLFRSFERGQAAVRRVVHAGLDVAMLRLSDADESYSFGRLGAVVHPPSAGRRAAEDVLDRFGFGEGRAALLVGVEGEASPVAAAAAQVARICMSEGGFPVGRGPGDSWFQNRFSMPYLRDPLLDRGMAVDTLETATTWSKLDGLYRAVKTALEDSLPPGSPVLCHISHTYRTGASLYFTFVWTRDTDAIGQWERAKRAAGDAIIAHGGTISHHHGVGRDHKPWLAAETGELALELLRAGKRRVDPAGVMNPGKLL